MDLSSQFTLRSLFDFGKASFDVGFSLSNALDAQHAADHCYTSSVPLKAHACVLQLHSSVFTEMIHKARSIDNSHMVILRLTELPLTFTETMWDVFIQYLYYGEVHFGGNINEKPQGLIYKNLLLLGIHFGLGHLSYLCLEYFGGVIAPDASCVDILNFGLQHGVPELVAIAMDVIETSKAFFERPEVLAEVSKDTIEYISAKSQKLPISEQEYCEWLLRWKTDPKNLASFDSLSQEEHLRFHLFPYDFLAKILNAGLLSDDEMMKVYKTKASTQSRSSPIGGGTSDAGPSVGGAPTGSAKQLTDMTTVQFKTKQFHVGFLPTDLPVALKTRVKMHLKAFKFTKDFDLRKFEESSGRYSSLDQKRTLDDNGVVDGSVLHAVPNPKVVFKLRPKVVKTRRRKSKIKFKRGRIKKLRPKDVPKTENSTSQASFNKVVENIRIDVKHVNNDGFIEENETKDFNNDVNNGTMKDEREALSGTMEGDTIDIKSERHSQSHVQSPPRCRSTASEMSNDAHSLRNDDLFSPPPASKAKEIAIARDRVFWWKASRTSKAASESCFPAIKSTSSTSPDKDLVYNNSPDKDLVNNNSIDKDLFNNNSLGNDLANNNGLGQELANHILDNSMTETCAAPPTVEVKVEPEAVPFTKQLRPRRSSEDLRNQGLKRRSQERVSDRSTSPGPLPPTRAKKARLSYVKVEANADDEGLLDYKMRHPAAPEACFKQSVTSLKNDFAVGMKLEVPDPKAVANTGACVATVVDCVGPRLKLRLDGTDDRNDFWRLVDDASLKLIGYSEDRDQNLLPPLSYRKNLSTFRKFLFETLKDASLAPKECFKREPREPTTSFQVGQKLEAVDRKNEALICPATVNEATAQEILVHFDGWSQGTYDYWCRNDSRELFPVGWCKKNKHPLQRVHQE